MDCNITEVKLSPEERSKHIEYLLDREGLTSEKIRQQIENYRTMLEERAEKQEMSSEDSQKVTGFLDDMLEHLNNTGYIEADDCCYSGLALTGVDEEDKPELIHDHAVLKDAVKEAGLKIYDPAEAPFNPQHQLVGEPQVVSDTDILMVVASRFFTFTNLAASSGGGMEERTANIYNKMPVIVVKDGRYVSRMTTGARRIILLEYNNILEQKSQITDVIGRLREYEPGIGTCSVHGNTLLGFKGDKTVCLPGLIQDEFPKLIYDFAKYSKSN